jgi:TonB family protein
MIHRSGSLRAPALVLGLLVSSVAHAGKADVVPGTGSIKGSADKEVVRRVVRQHIAEVKACYERELPEHPGLEGRVVVKFTIGAKGQVVSSVLESSTLGVPRAENCIVEVVLSWEFPEPTGGEALVSYPFTFTPG